MPRERRFEADERVFADGSVLKALEPVDVEAIVARARASGADAHAVCLLFSFLSPGHEKKLKDSLIAAGCTAVSISHEVQPEFREFERMSTTVLNAYLLPLMSGYLQALEAATVRIAPEATLRINQSSGGLMSAAQAARFPVRTALSGPAAGAVGATFVSRSANRQNVITLDMGGTSADVCLIKDGSFSISFVGAVGGFPLRLPMADVNAVGAGGGSIAWIDRDGLMKVGPISAGARPGPACYGLGGELPTVTDANLILGRLDPAGLLEGQLPLDMARARAAFALIADRIGSTIEVTALGCLDIVVANMVRAIRAVSVEKGHDPKDFSLIAFGGGGPLHAHAVAASLGIREIIVPPHPGILCAQGLLAADMSESFVMTKRLIVSASSHRSLVEALDALLERAAEWYRTEQAPDHGRTIGATLDMRYVGQNYELSVPFDIAVLRSIAASDAADKLRLAFQITHEKQYGTSNSEAAVEVINVRITARVAAVASRPSVASRVGQSEVTPSATTMRAVQFGGAGRVTCAIYHRRELTPGMSLLGPTIVEQLDTTTVIFPGDRVTVDGASNLLIEVAE